MIFKVLDKAGNEVGQIEKFRLTTGFSRTGLRQARTWFRLVGNEKVNADTKANIASYLTKGEKFKIVT